MAKSDINLFKAAGGERAKSTKRSPVSIMLLVGLVIVVAALGVAAYFNLKVNTAKSDYSKLQNIQSNYERVLNDNEIRDELSPEYKTAIGDIESAAAINTYVETWSALYPEATPSEIKAIRNTIKNNTLGVSFTLTTSPDEDREDLGAPEEGEEEAEELDEEMVATIDYEALRKHLYDEEVEDFTDKELFYYALEKLAKKQNSEDYNIWYDYYRCYFVAVFTGGESNNIPDLVETLADPRTTTMGGQTPFSRYLMLDDETYTGDYYIPAKFKTIEFEDVNYQIVLLPLKSVVERAYDILSAHSNALVEANSWEGQPELAAFYVTNIKFSNEALEFDLYLPGDDETQLDGYMTEIDASHFFDVDWSVVRADGNRNEVSSEYDGEYTNLTVYFNIILKYKNRPVLKTTEQE